MCVQLCLIDFNADALHIGDIYSFRRMLFDICRCVFCLTRRRKSLEYTHTVCVCFVQHSEYTFSLSYASNVEHEFLVDFRIVVAVAVVLTHFTMHSYTHSVNGFNCSR